MTPEIENKLDKIVEIWNEFIWNYEVCSKQIKFDDDVKTNYFGDILNYFSDTSNVIVDRIATDNIGKFSYSISLLQAIYIQQDFIEELLIIFKTGVNKGHLKKDENYNVNRDIRNELIGHPIRKFEGQLISSALFSYNSSKDKIEYITYKRENSFKPKYESFSIPEIIGRHEQFLLKYFDIILVKLKNILNRYLKCLAKLETVIEKGKEFNVVLTLIDQCFEDFFKGAYAYDRESLVKIYSKKEEHQRYGSFIESFYDNLKISIAETKQRVEDFFETPNKSENEISEINTITYSFHDKSSLNINYKPSYRYELEKIATKRDSDRLGFFFELLRSKCKHHQPVLDELIHMEEHVDDVAEYYSSLRLIREYLKDN